MQEQPERTVNQRTPYFDLDSVYGNGPSGSAQLYDPGDPARRKVGTGGVFEDVPRDATGRALLGDPRNDENIILAGMHAAFLLFHNRAVDELRSEGIPEDQVFYARRAGLHRPEPCERHPDERSAVCRARPEGHPGRVSDRAYRFGHSMVRPSYRANLAGDNGQPFFGFIFDPAEFGKYDGNDLTGGSSAPRRFVGWQTFVDLGDGESKPNKKIDTHISTPLFNLPPIAIPGGPSVLVQRTLLRHLAWGIPSGQQIARAMGAPILSQADLQELAPFDNSLLAATPLFYYVLKEAQLVASGEYLGPVGGRIVGEVFVNNLRNDPNSYLNVQPTWTPSAGGGWSFRMKHFLTYAGVDPASRDDTPVDILNKGVRRSSRMSKEVLQGTLDLMVLRTLAVMGPQHGFGLARRILQVSDGLLDLNQGTLYPALLRLEQRRWIKSRWGTSDNNRKAKFYELTARGRRQIREETESWELTVALMAKFLAKPAGEP